MNVLLYFEPSAREKLLSRLAQSLTDDGLLISGFNHLLGGNCRYVVYRKVAGALSPDEFAFSLDNLRPMGVAPWYTIHDGDPEAGLLADLTAVIRSDRKFWPAFNRRADDLLAQHAIFRRGQDGFLHFPEPAPPPRTLIEGIIATWRQLEAEGYAAGAVDALTREGYRAWENSVGDIAVRPAEGTLYTP